MLSRGNTMGAWWDHASASAVAVAVAVAPTKHGASSKSWQYASSPHEQCENPLLLFPLTVPLRRAATKLNLPKTRSRDSNVLHAATTAIHTHRGLTRLLRTLRPVSNANLIFGIVPGLTSVTDNDRNTENMVITWIVIPTGIGSRDITRITKDASREVMPNTPSVDPKQYSSKKPSDPATQPAEETLAGQCPFPIFADQRFPKPTAATLPAPVLWLSTLQCHRTSRRRHL